ncbi:MAG: dihydrofolate reductase family protein [Pseudomonadota bacterium]
MPGPGDSAHAFHGQPRRDREDRPRPDGTGAFSGDTWLDPAALVDALGRTGATEVLCEGGAGLAAGLLRAGLVDELVLFSAGAVIGADGRAGVDPIGLDRLGDAPRFTLTALDRIGDDAVGVWHPATVPP